MLMFTTKNGVILLEIKDETVTKEYGAGIFCQERHITVDGDADIQVSIDTAIQLVNKFINEDLIKIRQVLVQTLDVAACSMMIIADSEKQLDDAINRARIAWSYLKPILGSNALNRACAEQYTFYERKLTDFKELLKDNRITPFNKHMYVEMSKQVQDYPVLIVKKGTIKK